MKRRHKIGLLDLGRLPVTAPKIVVEGYETRAEFFSRERREEEQRREAPVLKLQGEIQAGLRENQENVRRFFSLPIDQLNLARPSSVPVDLAFTGDFPKSVERMTAEEYRVVQLEFWETLNARECHLTDSAWIRLNCYAGSICRELGLAVTVAVLEASFQRLIDLDCFNEGELTGKIPTKTVAKTQPPQPETENQRRERVEAGLENYSTESRAGREACLQIIASEFGKDVERMYLQWADSMREKWNADVMTEKIGKYAGDWFVKFNKNPLTPSNYDELRRVLSKLGYLGPLDYRTKDEKLADVVEHSDLNSRDIRQTIARHMREIAEEGPGRKGGITLK